MTEPVMRAQYRCGLGGSWARSRSNASRAVGVSKDVLIPPCRSRPLKDAPAVSPERHLACKLRPFSTGPAENGRSLHAKWRSGDTAGASFNGRDRQGGMRTSFDTPTAREAFDRLLAQLPPKPHRYCARMTGSVIDGEDLVQEALLKAIEALDQTGALANPEAWVFRI